MPLVPTVEDTMIVAQHVVFRVNVEGSTYPYYQDFIFPRICRLLYARSASLHYKIRVGPNHI